MKKLLRLFAVACAVVMLCMSMCACDLIDRKRASRADWTQVGQSFIYADEEYIKVGKPHASNLRLTDEKYIVVTNEEIPLLLTGEVGMGQSGMVDKDNKLAIIYNTFYATKENCDYVKTVIYSPQVMLDNFGVYINTEDEDGNVTIEFSVLPQAVKSVLGKAVEDYKSATEKTSVSNYDDYINIYPCDKKGMILKDEGYTLCKYNGSIYLMSGQSELGVKLENKYYSLISGIIPDNVKGDYYLI